MPYKLSDWLKNERIAPIETEDELHQIFYTIIGRIMKKISNDTVLEINSQGQRTARIRNTRT